MEEYSEELTDQFLKCYRELEVVQKDDPKRFESFNKWYQSKFDIFRSIRNNLSHNVAKDGDYPVIVSKSIVEDLRTILLEMNVKALSRAIRLKSIIYAKGDTPLYKVLSIMSRKNLSHMPIFDEYAHVVGVISESSMIDIFAKEKKVDIKNQLVKDYLPYFDMENNPNERYLFLDRKTYLSDARKLFENRYVDGLRLGVIFITYSGVSDEKIMGLLSAHNALREWKQ